jgi:hypothetical protein
MFSPFEKKLLLGMLVLLLSATSSVVKNARSDGDAWYWAALLPSVSLLGSQAKGNGLAIPSLEQLHSGDLIFRSGMSHESRMVRLMDPQSDYSHVGLVDIEGQEVYVIHIEPALDSMGQAMRREPLAHFLDGQKANAFTIYRVNTADEEQRNGALAVALAFLKENVAFDQEFDLDSVDALYCTELVWRAYKAVGIDLMADGDISLAGRVMGREVLRLSTIMMSPAVREW